MAEPANSDPPPGEREPKPSAPAADQGPAERADRVVADLINERLVGLMAPFLQPAIEAREQFARSLSSYVTPVGLLEAIAQTNKMAEMLRLPIETAMEAFSRGVLGNSMLTASLAARSANFAVLDILANMKSVELPTVQAATALQMALVTQVATLVERHNLLLTSLRPVIEVARPMALATLAWQDVIRTTPETEANRYLERIAVVGRGAGWAVQAGIALTEPDETRIAQLEAETSVALGPAVASGEVRARLYELDPHLCDRLDGAWARIIGGGADAASQAANSLMELIDWTLRELAPDTEVLRWHAAENRPEKELHERRPTRTLRIRFAVRDNPEKNSAVNLYVRATEALVTAIQAPKHTRRATDERALAPVALTVEGLLHFLLVE